MDISDIVSLSERIKNASQTGLNEANTKTSLVMPFLQAMGYDVFDHNEVAHEYTSDFGTKKGEKVDIAILRDGNPIIMIECKQLGDSLDIGKCSQLYRYFIVNPDVKIGILTNGQRYLFFSDLDLQNIMDKKPFMEIDLLNFNERLLPELQKFTKDSWDLEGALSSAQKLKYTRAAKLIIGQDIQEPSEMIVAYYAKKCYDGKVTHKVIDMFRPIIKRSFSEYISDLISKRLNSIQDSEEENDVDKNNIVNHKLPDEKGIITYENEKNAYLIIQNILKEIIDPSRVVMRDQKSYCGIILDDNNRKPICRLFNVVDVDGKDGGIGRNAFILIMVDSNEKGERYNLSRLEDIYPLRERLKLAAMRHENRKE